MTHDTGEGAAHKPRSIEITIEHARCHACQQVLEDGGAGPCSCQLVDEGEEDELELGLGLVSGWVEEGRARGGVPFVVSGDVTDRG